MFDIVDNMYIGAKIRMDKFISEFKKEERGVSNFVATIILILIVVLLCALFYDKIKEWFETLWARITGDAMGSLNSGS